MERLVSLVPGPYWLGSLAFAVLLAVPGAVLGNLLDTLDWDEAVARTFGAAGEPTLQTLFAEAFGAAFYFFVFLLVRYARRNLGASSADIVPLLRDGEPAFRRIFSRFHRLTLLGPLALGLALFFGYLALGSSPRTIGLAATAMSVIRLTLIAVTEATALLLFLVTLVGLHSVGKEPLLLRPYEEDRMLGLRPLGSMALTATFVYFGVLAVVIVPTLASPSPPDPRYLAFLTVLVLFGLGLFFLPLNRIHRRMVEEKARELEAMHQGSLGARSRGESRPASADPTLAEVRDILLEMRDELARERAERELAKVPTWPFEVESLSRIMALTVTGVVAIVGRFVVDYFFFYPR